MRKTNPLADSDGTFHQVIVYYNQPVRVGFHKENWTTQIVCPLIFTEPAQATTYGGMFVKSLIASGDLPADVLDEKGELIPERCKVGLNPLIVGALELDGDD